MNKNILVFGGYGFLGLYLVQELLKRGYRVTIADLHDKDIFSKNHSYIKYIPCDISDQKQVEKVFLQGKYDTVYNLAGFANLDNAIKYPLKTIELNVIGNIHILNKCVEHGVKLFLYASSAYAMSHKGSFYGISKLASEKIVEEYNKKYNLQFVILRYGSVYSERKYDNNYIYNVVKKAVLEKTIEHGGDGNEVREYIHAADASRLSVDVIENNEYINRHIILTGSERMRRKELFEMINEILNNQIDISYKSSEYQNHYKYTPYSFEPSVSQKLVANPHIDMGQGLLECVRAVYKNERDE